jgi:hypothetical protein
MLIAHKSNHYGKTGGCLSSQRTFLWVSPTRERVLAAVGLGIALSLPACGSMQPTQGTTISSGSNTPTGPAIARPASATPWLPPDTAYPASPTATAGSRETLAATSYPTVRVQASGTLLAVWGDEAIPEGYVDLDSGAFGESHGADLEFLVGGGTDTWPILLPLGGSAATFMGVPAQGTPAPSFTDCDRARDLFLPTLLPLWGPVTGGYVCVLTGEGRLSLVQIDAVPDYGPYSVSISFVTWE